jgi:HD-like signal output (HDOD) protein
MSDNLAQHVSVNYPEGAFVGGLMHDFGKLLMAVAMPAEYEQVDQMKLASGKPLWECEREVIGADHAALSAIALEEWNLPVQIRRAVEFHHRVTENPSFEAEKEGATFHLSELIDTADQAVNRLGVTVHELPPGATKHEHPSEPLQRLTDEEATWKLMGDFEREFEAIRKFF